MYLSYEDEKLKVSFAYSQYHELISSLHVLQDPQHHKSRLTWAETTIERMPHDLKDELYQISKLTINYMYLYPNESMLHLTGGGVDNTLDYLKKLSRKEFLDFCFEGEEMRRDLPHDFQERCISFLDAYYHGYMINELVYSQPILIRQMQKSFQACKDMGVYKFIHQLHPRIEVTEEKINFHKYKLFESYKSSLEQVILYMDSFCLPHLLLGLEDGLVDLIIPVALQGYDSMYMPKDALSLFKSIGDERRLQILKLLYKSPCSTQYIAEELQVSEACISKHLKLLYQANLVVKQRDGNYINYHLNQQVMDSILLVLYEVLN